VGIGQTQLADHVQVDFLHTFGFPGSSAQQVNPDGQSSFVVQELLHFSGSEVGVGQTQLPDHVQLDFLHTFGFPGSSAQQVNPDGQSSFVVQELLHFSGSEVGLGVGDGILQAQSLHLYC